MTKSVEIPQIQYTTELGQFKFTGVNRDTTNPKSQARIKAIKESMLKNGFKPTEPIKVSSKGVIIDGQHRLKAAEAVGCGVYYMVDKTIKNTSKEYFKAALEMNDPSTQRAWGMNDYLHGYVAQGNQDYVTLQNFVDVYGDDFTLTECSMFLMNSGTKHCNKKDFSSGKFKVASVELATTWADNILKLKPYFKNGYNKSVFVRSMVSILEKHDNFDFDRFLHKVSLRPHELVICGDRKTYKLMIEDIYNYKVRENDKLNLRF